MPGQRIATTPGSLRRSVISGVQWTTASALAVTLIGVLQTAVLARLLEPRDFGLIAVVFVALALAQSFADMGISAGIIARQESDSDTLSSLYWVNIASGVVVFGLVVGVTPGVVAFFGEDELGTLLPVAALAFLIAPVGTQFAVLLQRDLQFSRLATIDVAAACTGAVAAVPLAALGAGAASFVGGFLASTSFTAFALAAVGGRRWRPRPRVRLRDIRGYVGFGLYQMGERAINHAAANVDYIVIGRGLGATALGPYAVAYQIAMRPLTRVNPVLTRVAFPAFARRQSDDAALQRGYLHVVRLVASLSLPLLAVVGATAPVLVPTVFGPQWYDAIPILQVLAAVSAVKIVVNPVGSLVLAKNRPEIGFRMNVASLALMVIALSFAVQWGVLALAWTYLAVVVVVGMGWALVLERTFGLRISEQITVLRRPTLIAATLAGSVAAIDTGLAARGIEGGVRLAVDLTAAVVIYAGVVAVWDRQFVREVIELVRGTRSVEPAVERQSD
jgi:O-antigen/teichoic acid export membrane protein